LWWKLAVVRAIKKERKRAQKEYKQVPKIIKRSTLESQPSLEFKSIFLLHFTAVPVLSVCILSVFVLSQKNCLLQI